MTFDKLKEKSLSSVLAILVIIINYITFFSSKIDMETFMDKTISFSSISFGFLLAVLSLLLQSNSPAIDRIKNGGRFNDLISFNKKAVIASALLVFYALIYIGFKLDKHNTEIPLLHNITDRMIADTISLSIFIYQVTEVYLFLDLFYVIIKDKN